MMFFRTPSRGFSLALKATQALALAVVVFLSTGASDASARFNDLGHRMMCTCGCAQLLGECNHVGCQESGREREELSAGISAGHSDNEILASFSAKYGATVLAAPTTHGFDLVAWVAPFAVFLAAMVGTILLIRRWSADKPDSHVATPLNEALREQIRRETCGEGGISI